MKPDRSMILATSVDLIFPAVLMFSLFLLFAGHNAPGGGFVGGLTAGAAFVLRYIDAGPAAIRTPGRLPGRLLGAGLGVAILAGCIGWLGGGDFLEAIKVSLELPLIGTLKASSALLFDVGVYLVVVGLVLTVLAVLGAEEQR
ncbi:MAG: MnhB domain-containing protein [Actinomycetota bacterium]